MFDFKLEEMMQPFKILFILLTCILGTSFAVKPNIVFILADDLGLGDLSTYNPTNIALKTKHMDALAAGGMKFNNAHTASGVCSPTRYGVMMGDHPFRAGLEVGVQFNYSTPWISKDKRTIADVLRRAGYTTGYVGKWHLGYNVYNSAGKIQTGASTVEAGEPDWTKGITDHPFDRGFDWAFGHVASADIPPYKYFLNNKWLNTKSVFQTQAGNPGRAGYKDPDWDFNQIQRNLQSRAVEFITSVATVDKPFFLYLPLSSPHAPIVPNPDFKGKTPHPYTDFLFEVDSIVGAVVHALKIKGVFKNTLIILTSDNGAYKGLSNYPDHTGTGILNGVALHGEKSHVYEGGHRVPFIAHWGDGTPAGSTIKPGTVTNDLVNLDDFFRTAAAIAEEPITNDEGVDSWNILPILLGDGTLLRLRETNFSTSKDGHFVITKQYANGDEWKLVYGNGTGGFGVAGNIVNPEQAFDKLDFSKMQMFKLDEDLAEAKNLTSNGLSAAEELIARELHQLLTDYINSGHSNAKDPNTAKVEISSIHSEKNRALSFNIKVNSKGSNLHLDFAKNPLQDFIVKISDIQGKKIFSKTFSHNLTELDIVIPDLKGKVTLLTLQSEGFIFNKKLFQQK